MVLCLVNCLLFLHQSWCSCNCSIICVLLQLVAKLLMVQFYFLFQHDSAANEWWECLGIAQVVFVVNLHQLISGAKGGNLKMSTRWYFHCHDQHKTLHFMAIPIWHELHSKWSVANEIMLKLQSEREFKTTKNIYVMPSVFTITTSTCHPWKQLWVILPSWVKNLNLINFIRT
jgi:hypothetical protein